MKKDKDRYYTKRLIFFIICLINNLYISWEIWIFVSKKKILEKNFSNIFLFFINNLGFLAKNEKLKNYLKLYDKI